MKKLTSKFFFALAMTVALCNFAQANEDIIASDASAPCSSLEGHGEEALVRCYKNDHKAKFKANQIQAAKLMEKLKSKLASKKVQANRARAEDFAKLAFEIKATIITTRSKNLRECAELAARFKNESVSEIAAVNCRTSREVSLTKELNRFEQDFVTISKGTSDDSYLLSLDN